MPFTKLAICSILLYIYKNDPFGALKAQHSYIYTHTHTGHNGESFVEQLGAMHRVPHDILLDRNAYRFELDVIFPLN